MSHTFHDYVHSLPIVDVHEHHLPGVVNASSANLLQLLQQSYAGWAVARPYCLPSETRSDDPMLTGVPDTTWDSLQPWLESRATNFFVRNLVKAISAIHGDGSGEITHQNWEAIDRAIQASRKNPEWHQQVLRRSGIQRVVTDAYNDPLLDARAPLGANYRSVMRINAFALGWNVTSRDHNGNSAWELLGRIGLMPSTFDEYLDALDVLVRGMRQRGQVALKNALAYDRDLKFDAPDLSLARSAWGKPSPSAVEQKAFGDFVVDRLCQRAAQEDLPLQMHLGTGILRGSHPMNVCGLIERHPRTRFLLMHMAYPWSRDLLAMAFVYRNIWLDLTWSFLLSPTHFQSALHEAIEILPDEGRLMLGGDNWHVEESYGAMQTARRLIAIVLSEKQTAAVFGTAAAEQLARRILHENAAAFLQLGQIET